MAQVTITAREWAGQVISRAYERRHGTLDTEQVARIAGWYEAWLLSIGVTEVSIALPDEPKVKRTRGKRAKCQE